MKAIVIDVDGTITFSDRSLDCRAVEPVRSLELPVVIATGNVLCYARAVSRLLGTSGIIIAENGGVVEYREVEINSIYLKDCERVFNILSKQFPLERLDSENRKTEITLHRNFDVEAARHVLEDFPDIEIVDTGFAIHIKSKRINKGSALKRIAELMKLDVKDFVAIGDSPNDIEMLKTSGFGIAVGNAHPALKEVADMVTKEKHGAGVAEALRYLRDRGLI